MDLYNTLRALSLSKPVRPIATTKASGPLVKGV
jgi:hypothetical protein